MPLPDPLFEPDRHEPLERIGWDPNRARSTIHTIVEDVQSTREGVGWPPHVRDDPRRRRPMWPQYRGAAGVWTALAHLDRHGAPSPDVDIGEALHEVEQRYREREEPQPALLTGTVGLLLARWGHTESDEVADRLADAIEANRTSDADELMWGVPGTALAALQMYRWTDDDAWAERYRADIDRLWSRWEWNRTMDCHLWTQHLYGDAQQYVGACHGQFGNLYALLRGADLLEPSRRESLLDRTTELTRRLALVDESEAVANWPPIVGARGAHLVQWCHGAPGVVWSLAAAPDDAPAELEAWMNRAGRLIWRAGPLAKGHGLCHGTSGNGFALLKTWEETGESGWLQRARHFAMYAIDQYEDIHDEFDRGWYSLWTGDLGLAVFLQACLDERSAVPGFDVWR